MVICEVVIILVYWKFYRIFDMSSHFTTYKTGGLHWFLLA